MIKKFDIFLEDIRYQKFVDDKIDEGSKDIALSLLFLLGLVSGVKSQNNIDNPSTDYLNRIESFISNEKNIDDLWGIVGNGYRFKNKEDFEEKIRDNYNKLKNRSNKLDNNKNKFFRKEISIKKTSEIEKYIKMGYSPEQLIVDKDTIIDSKDSELNIQRPIRYTNDVVFISGGWELTNDFKESIKTVIEEYENIGFEITEIIISTSTDKEPIKIGNKKLSENRSESVTNYINSIISVDIKTTDDDGNSTIKYDQGPDLYHKNMTKEDRDNARELTKEYRKVTVIIKMKMKIDNDEPITLSTIINNENLTLVKIINKDRRRWVDEKNEIKYNKHRKSTFKKNKITYKCRGW